MRLLSFKLNMAFLRAKVAIKNYMRKTDYFGGILNYTNKELEEKGLSYIINGHHIHGFTNYKSNHPVKLMTLDEIRRKRCPQMKDEKVLYMINKFFILWEWEWYKVAEDFIWRVEVLPSYMLTPIQDNICEPFTIIRIFTKTHHNWHPPYLQ